MDHVVFIKLFHLLVVVNIINWLGDVSVNLLFTLMK